MLINTTRQEDRDLEKILSITKNGTIDALVRIIERLDAVITDKDAMIKRLQQGHKVL